MPVKIVEFSIPPESRDDADRIRSIAIKKAGLKDHDDIIFRIEKRSIDARKSPRYVLRVAIGKRQEIGPLRPAPYRYPAVRDKPAVHIIGAGPAGYFAALELITLGLRPVIIERGKDVQKRRRDLRAIQQEGIVDPNSNYCFGEGGAGTYSDGKLYTRATKRGDVGKVLNILVDHGAVEDILIEAHPHIGSNKLPKIVSRIRQTIEQGGGEVMFDSCLTDIEIRDGRIASLTINNKDKLDTDRVILATGHSARDIYELLAEKGIAIEFKPFALGVRVEHPQPMIDEIQYGQPRGEWLPAASYKLACQVRQRGVFSFCMCPGGLIVPAATAPGEIVVNGMSLSRRDSPYANSGMVAEIKPEDLKTYHQFGPLAGMKFQSEIEQACFRAGDGTQQAPAQRLVDFMRETPSTDLPPSSYIPGIFPHPIDALLPPFVIHALRDGFMAFGRKVPGFLTSDAVIVATESRTSAPVRIPRDPETLEHPEIQGLFPSGEGAGYAGGIVSAAIDGQNVAQSISTLMRGQTLKNSL